jgi:DUF4097 and DUF4098 domain-containing protein YvlB
MKTINTMIKSIFGLLLLICTTAVLGQEKGELIVPLSNPSAKGALEVSIQRGSINVVGSNRSDVLIKYASMESNNQDSQEVKNGMKRISNSTIGLEASENNNQIEVESDSWNKGIKLIIEVPKTMDLELDTHNGGDIVVENVTGNVVLENHNGGITAKGMSGSVTANTHNGTILVELNSVTPNIPMSFITYNGNVDVSLPSSVKVDFKLKSSRGEIYSGFDVALGKAAPVKKTVSKSGTYKVYVDDWVRGKTNGGGSEIVMQNYNGDIYIRKQ